MEILPERIPLGYDYVYILLLFFIVFYIIIIIIYCFYYFHYSSKILPIFQGCSYSMPKWLRKFGK